MKFQLRIVSALAVGGLVLAVSPGQAVAKRHRRAHAPAATAGAGNAEPSPAGLPKGERLCVAAFRSAQEHEQAGQLADAKQQWLKCARATCGSFLKQECTTRYTQLDTDIPSVVPVVTDDSGAPRTDVEVRIDGELVASQLDGRALPVDPGMHEFSFTNAGNVFAKQKLMILQGQRNRQISASLRSPGRRAAGKVKTAVAAADKPDVPATEAAAIKDQAKDEPEAASSDEGSEPKSERLPHAKASAPDADVAVAAGAGTDLDEPPPANKHALSYVLGGAGLAGIGAGALMIYWGRKDNDLLSQCSPGCSPAQVSHIRTMYLAGDITMGVGVASLAASYLVYALSHSHEEKATHEAHLDAHLLNVVPTTSGALAVVSGSF
jgi:hypothetical protein